MGFVQQSAEQFFLMFDNQKPHICACSLYCGPGRSNTLQLEKMEKHRFALRHKKWKILQCCKGETNTNFNHVIHIILLIETFAINFCSVCITFAESVLFVIESVMNRISRHSQVAKPSSGRLHPLWPQ